jgi:hypothetical protein
MRTLKLIKKTKIIPNQQQKRQMNKTVKSVTGKKKSRRNKKILKIDKICPKETKSVTKIASAQNRKGRASRLIPMAPAVLSRNLQLSLSVSFLLW